MRLRQIALASRQLETVTTAIGAVFGPRVVFNDPHIHHYGLRNAVMPAASGFLEVVEPIRDDASAARFINRRGGDAGYMVILQVADAEAERARMVALGAQVVDDIDNAQYRCAHFHPAVFGGVLVSVDQQRTTPDLMDPHGDWMPAGPDWTRQASDDLADLAAVTIAAPSPEALAARWSALLDRPLDPDDPLRLPLDRGEIRFRAGEGPATVFTGVDLAVAEPAAALDRARAGGLDMNADGVLIGGVRFAAVAHS